MGCYINVVNDVTGADHPTWEWGLSGNRDYASLYHSLPHEIREQDESLVQTLVPDWIRPTDFPTWRQAISAADLPNLDAHLGLMDILENDTRWWIRVSW